jgi:hypothetical protein
MFHMRKGIPIMYVGCFEWERTGSVTVESTQSWPGQILWWSVKQGWTELSPECGFKMPSEFYDVFRGVGPIKYFCSAVYNLQIHKYVWWLFWMGENRVCDGGENTNLTRPNFYKTSKFINMYSGCFEWERTGSVTVESTQSWPGQILWWRVHKVDLAKFYEEI